MEIEKNNPDLILSKLPKEKAKQYDDTKKDFIWNENDVIKKKVFPIDLHNNFLYYGLLLPKLKDNEIKGKKFGKKQILCPCLITSNRELLELDERLKEDLKLDFENLPSYLPSRWNLEKIKSYLDGNTEPVNGKELLNKIKTQYENYIFIRNKTWYKILSIWDIGTYLYVVFEAYPFIENRGIPGTAKTKDMTVSSFITFNSGQIMVNPTESTLFRETDEIRGTKYFDEAEKLWVFNKATKQYEGDVRTELINASYTKEGKVPRQEKIGNKFFTKWYSPYSPTRISSVNGLFGATETRAITRIATKSPDTDARGEKEPSEDRNLPIWAEIRDECYRFALENWEGIKEIYNNFPKDCGLKRRDFQIWKPLLAIAKYISEEDYLEILEFAKALTKIRIEDLIPESSFDFMILKSLKDVIQTNGSDKIYVEAIKRVYCLDKGDEEGLKDPYLNRNISNHLDKLGFKELRDRDRNGSFFAVTKGIFDEVVCPICPNLAFLSSPSSQSSHLPINNNKKSDDKMKICDDSKVSSVTNVMINDENDDTYEKEATSSFNKFKNNSLDNSTENMKVEVIKISSLINSKGGTQND